MEESGIASSKQQHLLEQQDMRLRLVDLVVFPAQTLQDDERYGQLPLIPLHKTPVAECDMRYMVGADPPA